MRANLKTWLIANVPTVAALSGQKVHVGIAPQRTNTDHVVITRDGEDPMNDLGGAGGMKSAEIGIDCKASTPDAAEALANAIRDELEPYTGAMGSITCKAVILNDVRDWEEGALPGGGVTQYVTTLDLTFQYT